jgi:hypothetical protein
MTEAELQASTRDTQADDLTAIILRAVSTNARLNVTVRALLALLSLAAATASLVYVMRHAQEMAAAIGGERPAHESLLARVFAQTWPVILLLGLAATSALTTWAVSSRGQDELERAMDEVGRLRREAEVAIPARGLAHVFDEKLANARRAYVLQLWLGRALFLVSLGLFAAAVVNAMAGGNSIVTGTFTAGSLAGALFGTAKRVPQAIAHHLANVVQVQCAITGCDRQIGIFETYAYALLADESRSQEEVLRALAEVHGHIEATIDGAISRIEHYADPGAPAARGDNDGDVIPISAAR